MKREAIAANRAAGIAHMDTQNRSRALVLENHALPLVERFRFTSRLERAETKAEVFATGGLYYIVVPPEIAVRFTTGKPVRIVCLLGGVCERHGAVRSRGNGSFVVGFGKEVVAKAGLLLGYDYTIDIWKDDDDYGLEPCEEFLEVLEQDPEAKAVWDGFKPGRKRSLLIYLNQPKSENSRIKRALEMAHKFKTNSLYIGKKG